MGKALIITDHDFKREVLETDRPVLVYFWANWCGPCRLVSPTIDTLVDTYNDRIKIVKMEIDPNPDTVKQFQVEGVPALRLIQAGRVIYASEGAITKQKLVEVLDGYLAAG